MCKNLFLVQEKEELIYGEKYEGYPIYDAYLKRMTTISYIVTRMSIVA